MIDEAPTRPVRDAPRSAKPLLRAVAWAGAAISILSLIGGIAGLATVETLGPIPDNAWAEIGLALFIAGAFLPFVTWLIHLALNLWVDDDQNWGPPRYGTLVSVIGAIAYSMLAGALLTFVIMGLRVAFVGDPGPAAGDAFIAVTIALVLGAVTVAAIAGGIAVMKWPGIIVGLLLGAGVAATSYGIYTDTPAATWPGIAALAAATAWFLLARRRQSQH